MSDNSLQNSPQDNAQEIGRDAARHATKALHRGAQAAQQNSHVTREAVQQAATVITEATQRVGTAASETLRQGVEAFAGTQRQFVQRTAEQFRDVSQKVTQAAHSTAQDMRTFMTLPNTANSGLQDVQQSMAGFVEGVMRVNLQATQELIQFANPGPFIELQQRFLRGYLDTVMQGTVNVVRATRHTADETLQQIERRQQASWASQHQHAAE